MSRPSTVAIARSIVAVVAGFTWACGPVLPDQPVPRALARDVARIVDVRQRIGWLVDDVEVTAVLPDALKSACRVDAANRTATLSWLDDQIARQGGSPVEAWRRAGKDLDAIGELLLASRARLLLARADEWARAGRCPFWLEPDPAFDGVQVLGHRFVFGAEAGGRLIIGAENGVIGGGAGGGGRVLAGYGFTDRLTLYLGLEGGGGARFTSVPIGEKASIPDFLAIFALPVVGRYSFGHSGFVEGELGFMTYFNQFDARLEPGIRAGVGVGGRLLRLNRGLLPRVTFAIAIDHAPSWGNGYPVTQLSGGLRAGFDLSR